MKKMKLFFKTIKQSKSSSSTMSHLYRFSTFHICNCGYQIESLNDNLIKMKIKLHQKKCNTWQDATSVNVGHINLPTGVSFHQANTKKDATKEAKKKVLNTLTK